MVNKIKKYILPFAVIFMGISFTGAYFSDSVSVSGNTFTAGVWDAGDPEPPDSQSNGIVINEVYYNPDIVHGGPNAEWIEIYNAGEMAINIKNWYFKNKSTGVETINQNYILDPGQFSVVCANASTISNWPLIPSNAHKIALDGSKLFNGLVNDGDNLQLFDSEGNPVDSLSWGSDISILNPSIVSAPQGGSSSRDPNGVDTDSYSDFTNSISPTPGGPNV